LAEQLLKNTAQKRSADTRSSRRRFCLCCPESRLSRKNRNSWT
jgi:hypothetical protein